MTPSLDEQLLDELAALESRALRRRLPGLLPGGGASGSVDLVGNDYLGLARDPRLGRLRILPARVRTLLGEKRALGILFFLRNYLFLTSWFLGLVSPDYLFSLYYPSQRQPTKISYAEMVSMRAQTTNQQAWTRAD